jgi:hypothetical protein
MRVFISHHCTQSTAVPLPSLFRTEQSLPVPSRNAAGSRAKIIYWLFRHGNLPASDPPRSWGPHALQYPLRHSKTQSICHSSQCCSLFARCLRVSKYVYTRVACLESLLPRPGFVRNANQQACACMSYRSPLLKAILVFGISRELNLAPCMHKNPIQHISS